MAIYNWKYDRNSRVIKVSIVEMATNVTKESPSMIRDKRGAKNTHHKIDTPSITTKSLIHFQHKLNKEK